MSPLKSGRHPVVIALLIFMILSGVGNLVAYRQSASGVIQTLPIALGYVYFLGLCAGSVVVLMGLTFRTVTGPLLERAGYWMLAGVFSAYGVLAAAFAWPRALFTASFLIGFAVGCVWRVVQIGRGLRGGHISEPRSRHRVDHWSWWSGRWRPSAIHYGGAATEDFSGGEQGAGAGFGDRTEVGDQSLDLGRGEGGTARSEVEEG